MAEMSNGWADSALFRALSSIQARKAQRVKLETGPLPLETRLAALVAKWQLQADRLPTRPQVAMAIMACAEELQAELDR